MNETERNDEILTLAEMAEYLKVSQKTVLRMVRRGELPGGKVSSRWRFQRTVIDEWLTSRMKEAPDSDLVEVMHVRPRLKPVPHIITPDRILLDMKPASKPTILAQLVQPLRDTGVLPSPDLFFRELLDRENIVSTAVGGGLAIPHVREQETTGIAQTYAVLGICRDGTDFDSLDGLPTYVFILLCADSLTEHLRLLAKIVLMFRIPGIVDRFRSCRSNQEVIQVLMDAHFDLSVKY